MPPKRKRNTNDPAIKMERNTNDSASRTATQGRRSKRARNSTTSAAKPEVILIKDESIHPPSDPIIPKQSAGPRVDDSAGVEQRRAVMLHSETTFDGRCIGETVTDTIWEGTFIEGVLKKRLEEGEEACRKEATERRLNCFLISSEASVRAIMGADRRMKSVATFQLTDSGTLDMDAIQMLKELLRKYQELERVNFISVNLETKYSCAPRRLDITIGQFKTVRDAYLKDLKEYFKCEDHTCSNLGRYCFRFQMKHFSMSETGLKNMANSLAPGEKPVLSVILEFVANKMERIAEMYPGEYEMDDIKKACSQDTFIADCFPCRPEKRATYYSHSNTSGYYGFFR